MSNAIDNQSISTDSCSTPEKYYSEKFYLNEDLQIGKQAKQFLLLTEAEKQVDISFQNETVIADKISRFQNKNGQKPSFAFENNDQLKLKLDIISQIFNEVQKISESYQLSAGSAFNLLRSFNYSFQDCFSLPNNLIQRIFSHTIINQSLEFICECCSCSLNEINFYTFDCRHSVCEKCFEEHMKQSINQNPDILSQTCPVSQCKEYLGLKDVQDFFKLIGNLEYFDNILIDEYSKKKNNQKNCNLFKSVNCFQFDQMQNNAFCNQICNCEQKFFCSSCGKEAHQPITCQQKLQWDNQYQNYDQKTIQYLTENKKACKSCKWTIEKNGGCDQMSCVNYKKNFCLVYPELKANNLHSNNLKNQILDINKVKLLKFQQKFNKYNLILYQSKMKFNKNIQMIQERIEIVFKNENELKQEMELFIIPSMNLLIQAIIVYQHTIPLTYFQLDNLKIAFLKLLQQDLKLQIRKLEKQLIEKISKQLDIEKIVRYNYQLDLKSKYNLMRIKIQKQVDQLKQSLENVQAQINSNFTDTK
ncbi:hypothetical protein ABPG74_007273 [Tetrahymena malaccensis]